jgi:hypothetical protein
MIYCSGIMRLFGGCPEGKMNLELRLLHPPWTTSGGVSMSAFPSYLASAQSFAAQYGSFVTGVVDPTKFAQALVSAGFNPGKLPLGNPNFVKDTAGTINATKGRMGCS